jgi:putative endonuclease
MLARLMFAIVSYRSRNGLVEARQGTPSVAREDSPIVSSTQGARQRARQTGVRGETYAYWYLRRQGYVLVARNYTSPGIKGELDMVGYDGAILAFIEVKTRAATQKGQPTPEEAVNADKRRYLTRMARQFARTRHEAPGNCRFDVLAIETCAGKPPQVRLHKGAFTADRNYAE